MHQFGFFIFTSLFLEFGAADSVYLYGADPRGGLWGAKVNLSKVNDINSVVEYDRFFLLEESIDVAVYDHTTKSIILRAAYDTSSSLYYGPLCHKQSPPSLLAELDIIPLNDDQLGDCVNCETSGFALHNGKLYFLLYGEFFSSDTISRLVQIRVFEACGQCGVTGLESQFDFTFHDMIQCSSVISEIIREQSSFSEYNNMEVKGGKGMKVIQHGDHMSFFFLLGNITRFDQGHDKVSLSLWYADDRGHQKELYTEELRSEFSAWNIRAMGSLDYSHHYICWSGGDRIICAEYSDHHLHHQVVLMTPLEAATSGVCPDASAEDVRISGVAITRSGGENFIFFGCHPEDPASAGTGMIYFSDGEKHIRSVRSATGPLLAGSLFIEKDLSGTCPSSLDLDICLRLTGNDQDDHQSDHGHSGHLHLDLSESSEAGGQQDDQDNSETDQLNTETKSDVKNIGDNVDDVDDDDIVYDGNEMPLDDYKYLYKTQELVQGEGGAATIPSTLYIVFFSVITTIIMS